MAKICLPLAMAAALWGVLIWWWAYDPRRVYRKKAHTLWGTTAPYKHEFETEEEAKPSFGAAPPPGGQQQ